MRTAEISRKTAETLIDVTINLDGTGVYAVSTGIGFLDHMLEQLRCTVGTASKSFDFARFKRNLATYL